jgi:hypothetical protein
MRRNPWPGIRSEKCGRAALCSHVRAMVWMGVGESTLRLDYKMKSLQVHDGYPLRLWACEADSLRRQRGQSAYLLGS